MSEKLNIEDMVDLRDDIVKDEKGVEFFKKDWKSWNILYCTLWFAENFSIDVEFCHDALASYKKYLRYKNKIEFSGKTMSHHEVTLTADIMNGWWGPLKILFFENNEIREKGICNLRGKIESSGNRTTSNENLTDWIYENYQIDKAVCQQFFSFLRVVYTVGNMTPAAINTHADKLDSWEYKLKNKLPCLLIFFLIMKRMQMLRLKRL